MAHFLLYIIIESQKEFKKTNFGKVIKIMKRILFFSALLLMLVIQVSYAGDNTFPPSGNVGIGTTSPTSLLHVKHPSGNLVTRFEGNTNYYSSKLYISSAYSGDGGIMYDAGTNLMSLFSYGDMKFHVSTGTLSGALGTERMRITQGGNVGIGTTSPMSNLDVKNRINVTNAENVSLFGLKGTRFGYSSGYKVLQVGSGHVGNEANVAIGVDLSGNPSGGFQGDGRTVYFRNGVSFGTPNSTNNGFYYPIILKDGKVGINTGYNSTPAQSLEVKGDVYVLDDGGNPLALIGDDTQNYTSLKYDSTANYGRLQSYTANAAGKLAINPEGGNVGIGTTDPQSKLAVDGTITAKEVVVTLDGWSDFVFENDYTLMPLNEVERQIKENKHLPDIPSADEVAADGVSVGEMQAKLLQKVEELTLYVIELNKENEQLKKESEQLKARVSSLENANN